MTSPQLPKRWLSRVIARIPPESMANCELTCIDRVPIDVQRIRTQHRAYLEVIEQSARLAGTAITVIELERLDTLQDSMFVEDVAVVFDELVVLTRPGAVSRRGEVDFIVPAVTELKRPVARIAEPGTLEGGDTLVVGKFVFVGKSTRTNVEGFQQLEALLTPHGYRCFHVPIVHCLHMKSAASMLDESTVLVNPQWVDVRLFAELGLRVVEVAEGEPHAANALSFTTGSASGSPSAAQVVVVSEAFSKTADRVRRWAEAGGALRPVHVVTASFDEIGKAEGDLTCCSLLCYDR